MYLHVSTCLHCHLRLSSVIPAHVRLVPGIARAHSYVAVMHDQPRVDGCLYIADRR